MRNEILLGVVLAVLVSGCVSVGPNVNQEIVQGIGIGLPTSDVSGTDVPGLRYPNTVRFEYSEDDCGKMISYYTTDDFSNVVEFYRNLEGWKLESQSNEAGPTVSIPNVGSVGLIESTSLSFSKGEYYLDVSIEHVKIRKKDYVIIDLNYQEPCGDFENQEPEQTNEYDTAVDVPVLSGAQNLDNLVKPVLESVFGGAKAVSSTNVQQLSSIDYIVKRTITLEDVTTIANSIAAKGYELTSQSVDESHFELSFSQNGIPKLGVSGDIGFQKITATMIEE